MVLDKLGSSLKNTLGKIAKSMFVDEKLLNELVKDIQRALLQSDVNVQLVFNMTNSIKQRFKSEDLPKGLSKKEQLINIVYDELTNFLGKKYEDINIDKKPTKIMLVGLFGNGKTTTAGKLAKFYFKRGQKVALISTDTWRPAAYKQLLQTGEKIGIPVYGNPQLKDPVKIYLQFEDELNNADIIIIDTAGRDALNDELITELNSINKTIKPDETLLVMSADIGQTAQKQVEKFHQTCNVTGVIITKFDGTAKGGGALSACSITGSPVKFLGTGEKIDDLEKFDPKRFVGRLLGMGDLETLLEKAKDAMSEDKAKDLGKRFLKGQFNLIDLYEQMEAMNKMGPLSKIVEMIPGFSQIQLPKEALQVQQEKLKTWRFIMDSCTKKELENPDKYLSSSSIGRVAKGSGRSIGEVRELLKQYKQSKKMAKLLKGGTDKKMANMMKKFQGMKLK